jgi:glycogen debranching enzyme
VHNHSTLTFDVREIPFSLRGSWLDISPVVALHTAREDLHLVTHQAGMHPILRLVAERGGNPISAEWIASASTLAWSMDGDRLIEVAFERGDILRVRGRGADLAMMDAAGELTPFTGNYLFRDPIDGAAVFTSYESGRRYRITSISGELRIDGSEALGEAARAVVAHGPDGWEVAIEEFETARAPYLPLSEFDAVAQQSAASFESFADAVAGWRDEHTPAAELAAYVLWSATVSPLGFLRRESVLMSKHWMDKVWSWDHCFNALALASADPALAMDQFLTPFDHMDSSGALPDSVAHSEILYNFVKPPIHGWALRRLRETIDLDRETLLEVYAKLSTATLFWLNFRRVPGHALPHYQHGNDSGWDNSTTFDRDRVIESPDLAGFLLIQLEVLAGLAAELGVESDEPWRREHDAILSALTHQLWNGTSFVAVSATSGRASKTGSLLNLLPIVAAGDLSPEIGEALALDIALLVTDWGPATQVPDSDEYQDDGYWRGPIWAPSTILIADGLRRSGHTALADDIAERFLRLCEKSGFAENFDAVTGEGLRDRAYTWTASAYLLLARQAAERRDAPA